MRGSFYFGEALLPDGWAAGVRVESDDAGRIVSIVRDASPREGDLRYAVAIPGLPNLHSHAFQRAMAGLTEVRESGDDSFWSWRELMYRFLEHLSPQHVHDIASLAYVEMLEAGFTHVCEFHYLHHDPNGRPYDDRAQMCASVAAAASESGIGLTLLPVFYACGAFGGAPLGEAQRRFGNDVDEFRRLHADAEHHLTSLDDARLGVALHSLRAVAPEHITPVTALAPDGPLHIHVAEQPKEVSDCIAWCGRAPVRYLLDEVGLNSRWCLVHATHIDAEECEQLARSGAVAGVCPITEANLGDGIFDGVRFLDAGGALGVGSDCNVRIDAAGELAMLEYSQRLRDGARNRLVHSGSTGRSLLDRALTGGAIASGGGLGELALGARLDFVSLDPGQPSLAARSRDGWLDGWIFSAGSGAIEDVWVAGRRRVEHGRHVARDAIVARYASTLASLI